jgi:cyclic beta-1,2-glucan synthetase
MDAAHFSHDGAAIRHCARHHKGLTAGLRSAAHARLERDELRRTRGGSVAGLVLRAVLNGSPLCEPRDAPRAARYVGEARRLAVVLERCWDGEWYRRGYYDDGTPLGSAQNDECKIDSIAQSWAVLSGAAPLKNAERAIDAVRTT